jgi:hypothetical protein
VIKKGLDPVGQQAAPASMFEDDFLEEKTEGQQPHCVNTMRSAKIDFSSLILRCLGVQNWWFFA